MWRWRQRRRWRPRRILLASPRLWLLLPATSATSRSGPDACRDVEGELVNTAPSLGTAFTALARSQFREAREKLDASPGEFAEMLTKLVGRHVPSGVVEAWERSVGGVPP